MRLFYIIGIILTILLIVYTTYYYRYPREVNILQTSLGSFKDTLLMEKQPIVIDERLEDVTQLQKIWFNYNLVKVEIPTEGWERNRYKYLVVQPSVDCEVFLYPANKRIKEGVPDPEETIIAIAAKAGQVIIVPLHWYILNPDSGSNVFGVHDLITRWIP